MSEDPLRNPMDQTFRGRAARWLRPLNYALAVGAVLGVAALAIEYGFGDPSHPPVPLPVLLTVQILVISLFVANTVTGLLAAQDRRHWLAAHWLDATLVVFFVGVALTAALVTLVAGPVAGEPLGLKLVGFATLFVVLVKLYLGAHVLLHMLRGALMLGRVGMQPGQWVVLTFAAAIAIGTALLMLPAATVDGAATGPLDALFTSTSAVCVTGLIVVDTGTHWSMFGQTVILVLIQLGGLGIMTFGAFAALMIGRGLSLRGRAVMQDVLNYEMVGRIRQMLKFVVILTFVAEAIGAALLWDMWGPGLTYGQRLYKSVFHSISAFCNAGFSLQGDSLAAYRRTWQVHAVFTGLIILGGLGFPVLSNLWGILVDRIRRRRREARSFAPQRLTLHSKIVLIATACLLILGTGVLWLTESPPSPTTESLSAGQERRLVQQIYAEQGRNLSLPESARMRDMDGLERLREAWFMSVTARTAGFNSAEMGGFDSLSPASQLTLVGLMFIGGSPSSTAGGIKTVSLAVMFLILIAVIRRRPQVEAFGRTIPRELVRRSAALFFFMLGLLAVGTLIGCAFQPELSLSQMLFEMTSALGTVGLSVISTQTTGELAWPTKLVLILGMYVGRLGPLTFMFAVLTVPRAGRYDYPEEPVIIG